MAGYLDYPVNGDPDYWTARILDRLAELIPGWTPGGEGTPEVALAEAFGQVISELSFLLGDVSSAVVRFMGQSLYGVQYLPGAASTIPVTISTNRQRVTIPAGFTVTGATLDGLDVAFTLPTATTTGNGTSVTVTMTATAFGAYADGVPAGPLTIATSTGGVTAAAATAPSDGGVDPETDSEYQDRLVATLSTLTRTPILARDFAVRARDVNGVHRAYAVDGYDPANGSTNNQRFVTVFPLDETGAPVPPAAKTELLQLLDGLREVNFEVRVADPTYTPVNLQFTAVAEVGADPATVRAAIIARGRQLLSPATWAGGEQSPPVWTGDGKVRYLEMSRELGSVPGVAYLSAFTINGYRDDLTLTGVAPLPASPTASSNPSTVSGTVS